MSSHLFSSLFVSSHVFSPLVSSLPIAPHLFLMSFHIFRMSSHRTRAEERREMRRWEGTRGREAGIEAWDEMREKDRKGDERKVTGTRRNQAREAAWEDETMINDERMKGDSRGGQKYMIANTETMGGLINSIYKCKLIVFFKIL